MAKDDARRVVEAIGHEDPSLPFTKSGLGAFVELTEKFNELAVNTVGNFFPEL